MNSSSAHPPSPENVKLRQLSVSFSQFAWRIRRRRHRLLRLKGFRREENQDQERATQLICSTFPRFSRLRVQYRGRLLNIVAHFAFGFELLRIDRENFLNIPLVS